VAVGILIIVLMLLFAFRKGALLSGIPALILGQILTPSLPEVLVNVKRHQNDYKYQRQNGDIL